MTDKQNALLVALNKVMQEVGYVKKGKTNDFHRYNYAGEEDLLRVLRPALVENGLLLIPSLAGEPTMDAHGNTHLVMEYTLAHVSGDVWPDKIRVPGTGNDKNKTGSVGDKGTYKALTGANKYMLFKLFQIATGDDPEVASAHDTGGKKVGEIRDNPTVKVLKEDEGKLRAKLDEVTTLEEFIRIKNHAKTKQLLADLHVVHPDWLEGKSTTMGEFEGTYAFMERRSRELQEVSEEEMDALVGKAGGNNMSAG